jgi:drug/metabolite transporter (DMT)-like permease
LSVLANLWTVYLVWGSTYLAIRVAVETIPPLLGAGVRFIIAGLILALFLRYRGRLAGADIGRPQVAAAALVGVLLLGANGLVMAAERTVPSGLAALLVASVPLWIVLLRLGDRQRISRTTLASVALGFAGVAILVLPHAGEGLTTLAGPLLLIAASASWAGGSFLSQRLPLPRDPLVSTSLQMLLGGVVLTAAGGALGEVHPRLLDGVSASSALALAYLVVFGSLVGFTAYTWLLHHAPVSTVATYAYVNPVVAVFLGWAILGERIDAAILAGAAVIVASVAFVVRRETLSRRPTPPAPPEDRGPAASMAPAGGGSPGVAQRP